MTPIRQRIAARLLQARQQTAMLTTFNEADMSWVKKIRSRHQEQFTKRHGIKLGMMSFFVKASIEAGKSVYTKCRKPNGAKRRAGVEPCVRPVPVGPTAVVHEHIITDPYG